MRKMKVRLRPTQAFLSAPTATLKIMSPQASIIGVVCISWVTIPADLENAGLTKHVSGLEELSFVAHSAAIHCCIRQLNLKSSFTQQRKIKAAQRKYRRLPSEAVLPTSAKVSQYPIVLSLHIHLLAFFLLFFFKHGSSKIGQLAVSSMKPCKLERVRRHGRRH